MTLRTTLPLGSNIAVPTCASTINLHLTDVVSKHLPLHAGYAHSDEPVADVRQIKIEPATAGPATRSGVNEAALVDRYRPLQLEPELEPRPNDLPAV